jgi:Ca2+-binding EF-hand superfamily protein
MKRILILLLLVICLKQVSSHNDKDEKRNVYNKDHLKEELGDMFDEEELGNTNFEDNEMVELHYFKLHDTNNDNKLDGLELGAAMTHFHSEDENGAKTNRRVDISDEELSSLIEQILKDDDLNNDGYVDFYEFTKAQRRGMEE